MLGNLLLFLLLVVLPIILTIPLIMSMILRKEKFSAGLVTVLSLVPILNYVSLLIFLFIESIENEYSNLHYYRKKFNEIVNCNSCGIRSKQGRTLIHNEFNGYEQKCPFCNSSNISQYNYYKDEGAPLSKTFGYIETFKLKYKCVTFASLSKKKSGLLFKDSQLEKYQKLQQEKLEEMLKHKERVLDDSI